MASDIVSDREVRKIGQRLGSKGWARGWMLSGSKKRVAGGQKRETGAENCVAGVKNERQIDNQITLLRILTIDDAAEKVFRRFWVCDRISGYDGRES